MLRLRAWWRLRHYRLIKKNLKKLVPAAHQGIAYGILVNILIAQPHSKREVMLINMGDSIEALLDKAVEKKGVDKLELT